MKITELRCPCCGGQLSVSEKNPMIAVCEYCNAHIALEWENNQPFFNQQPYGQPTHGQPSCGQPAHNQQTYRQQLHYQMPEQLISQMNRRQESPNVKRTLLTFAAIMTFLVLINVPAVYRRWKQDQAADAAGETVQAEMAEAESSAAAEKTPLSGNLGELAASVFGLPAEDVSDEDLAKIQWLEMKYEDDMRKIGYSFDAPDGEDAQLTWLSFSKDSQVGQECLCRFTGLKRLNMNVTLKKEYLEGLKLESIGGYFHSPGEVAGIVDDVSCIKELQFFAGADSLEDFAQFSSLETLYIGMSELGDVDALRNLPNLKKLELKGFDMLSDFSVFGTMDGIEELSLESENLRAINFLGGMKSLKCLEIKGGIMISLDGIQDRPELEALVISDCDQLKNMDAVTQLSGLKELSLDLPYECQEPNLGSLTGLEHLALSGFNDCSFIEKLTQLQSLDLDHCHFSRVLDLSGLTGLKELSYYSFAGTGMTVDFIMNIPCLEKLNMQGLSTYDDISRVFNMKHLKELKISGIECEIDFDRIADNQTLERLYMNEVTLYKNVQVSGGGGIVYVDWDDVVLDEHTEFLGRLKALKHLSIRGNHLTDLSFAKDMAMLETIDLTDNYITELRPLAELDNLREVIGTGNPISNKNVLNEHVSLIFQ